MKILIISYYFEPCIGIAPNRSTAFAHNFSKSHEVKVVTRHWNGNEDIWTDYLDSTDEPLKKERINDNLEIIRTPYVSKVQNSNKFKTLINLFSGKLDVEIDSLQFYHAANGVISDWKPDIMFVSSPPKNLIQLANKLYQKHDIPFIADFRDFENHMVLMPERKKKIKESILFSFTMKHLKKDLAHAKAITGVNLEICEFLSTISKKPYKLIFNGYETSIFENFIPVEQLKIEYFTISIIGTVYPNQDLAIFLKAFQMTIQIRPEINIRFHFIGTYTIPEIGEEIKKSIPEKHLFLTKKVPRKEALKHLEKSHLVWQPEMVGYKGVYSGKIFEYLGAKRTIMVAPSVGDVLDDLLYKTNAGKSFKTSQEITDYILKQYDNWATNGFIRYEGNHSLIQFYSRENQSKELLNWIQTSI